MKDEALKLFSLARKRGEVIFNPKQAYENEAEVASLLKMKKEEVENLTSDFKYTIQSITRYHEAAVNQDLFDKVFGEGVVKSEKEFKEKIKENIAKNLSQDSNYKFGLDAREVLVKKYKDLSFPDAFLKRWLLRTNKDLTEETLETDYPKMREDLTWQLIRNKIVKAHDVKIEKEDVEAYAKQIARSHLHNMVFPMLTIK